MLKLSGRLSAGYRHHLAGVLVMREMQKMLDGSFVPTRPHPDDFVECSDGSVCRRYEAVFDAAGCAHSTDEERFDANVEIVRDILAKAEKWSEEYHTGNSDYPDGIAYIVSEDRPNWNSVVKEWISEEYYELFDGGDFDDFLDGMVSYVCDEINDWGDYEPEYSSSDYACYGGNGCCLYSFDIGECEELIDITDDAGLLALHDSKELNDIIDELDREFCIHRSQRRVRNEETGHYENVGRKTYDPYGNSWPYLLLYTLPGGIWHFVVSDDRMRELVQEYVDEYGAYDD